MFVKSMKESKLDYYVLKYELTVHNNPQNLNNILDTKTFY